MGEYFLTPLTLPRSRFIDEYLRLFDEVETYNSIRGSPSGKNLIIRNIFRTKLYLPPEFCRPDIKCLKIEGGFSNIDSINTMQSLRSLAICGTYVKKLNFDNAAFKPPISIIFDSNCRLSYQEFDGLCGVGLYTWDWHRYKKKDYKWTDLDIIFKHAGLLPQSNEHYMCEVEWFGRFRTASGYYLFSLSGYAVEVRAAGDFYLSWAGREPEQELTVDEFIEYLHEQSKKIHNKLPKVERFRHRRFGRHFHY